MKWNEDWEMFRECWATYAADCDKIRKVFAKTEGRPLSHKEATQMRVIGARMRQREELLVQLGVTLGATDNARKAMS